MTTTSANTANQVGNVLSAALRAPREARETVKLEMIEEGAVGIASFVECTNIDTWVYTQSGKAAVSFTGNKGQIEVLAGPSVNEKAKAMDPKERIKFLINNCEVYVNRTDKSGAALVRPRFTFGLIGNGGTTGVATFAMSDIFGGQKLEGIKG